MALPRLTVHGSTALVTGAAGGMGEHIARGLARRGCDIVLVDVLAEGLERVAESIRAESPAVTVTTDVVDLSDRSATEALGRRVATDHPDLNLVFNNAGVALGGRLNDVDLADIDWLLEINLHAPIRLTHALLPLLMENGNAHVVNTSSLFGLIGPPGQTPYCTAKFGLRGFSESLRSELAERRAPVGLTVVHPGGIRTNIATHARIGARVDPVEKAEQQKSFEKLLHYPADRAAEEIIEAAIARRPRLLIGSDAKALDVLARLAPGSYWRVLGPLMAAGQRRSARSRGPRALLRRR